MVSANWRKNWPVMPGMNAVGHEHRATAPARSRSPARPTSSIVLCAASRGDMPLAMWRSTVSTTTMASSTTMPMASTRPNSVRLFSEKPNAAITAKVPMSETGIATSGMIGRAPVLQEHQHDERPRAAPPRAGSCRPRWIDSRDELRRVVGDAVVDALREVALRAPPSSRCTSSAACEGVGAGPLEDAECRPPACRRGSELMS